ncbi:hypothetical protein [Chrysiogenes arsenatis]|nr:hypothetical protein [Chrysiogenes arsenatis]
MSDHDVHEAIETPLTFDQAMPYVLGFIGTWIFAFVVYLGVIAMSGSGTH